MTTSDTTHPADRAGNNDTLEHLARIGLVAYGLMHLLVAWLALQLAWGGGGGSADQSGAMATLAKEPFGKPLLWVLAVGLLALALWQLAEVLRYRTQLQASGKPRKKAVTKIVKAVAKTVVYLGLAITAVRFAAGGGKSSSGQQQQAVGGVLGLPGGRFLVGIAALILIGVGVNHVRKAVKGSFMKEIDTAEASPGQRRLIERLGQFGYPAKGVALALVGGLIGWAAITFDPSKARGLDGAMHTILAAPAGQWLLTLVAVGVAAFGVFSFFRARYPQRT